MDLQWEITMVTMYANISLKIVVYLCGTIGLALVYQSTDSEFDYRRTFFFMKRGEKIKIFMAI